MVPHEDLEFWQFCSYQMSCRSPCACPLRHWSPARSAYPGNPYHNCRWAAIGPECTFQLLVHDWSHIVLKTCEIGKFPHRQGSRTGFCRGVSLAQGVWLAQLILAVIPIISGNEHTLPLQAHQPFFQGNGWFNDILMKIWVFGIIPARREGSRRSPEGRLGSSHGLFLVSLIGTGAQLILAVMLITVAGEQPLQAAVGISSGNHQTLRVCVIGSVLHFGLDILQLTF